MTLPREARERKRLFRIALAATEMTAKYWCAREGYSESHLYQVLRGERISPATDEKIDAFIRASRKQVA